MKKFAVMAAFVFTVVAAQFFGVTAVEARDVYVGTSDTTGYDCYLVRDSVSYNDSEYKSFSCKLKMVSPSSGEVHFLYYDFWLDEDHYYHFKNSQGFSGRADDRCPIEQKIVRITAAS